MNRKLCLLSLLLFFLRPGFAKELNTENFKQHADLEIYYSAFPSSFISPKIANSNQIIQRKDLGIVNIVGLKRYGNYVPLAIHGNVKNIFQFCFSMLPVPTQKKFNEAWKFERAYKKARERGTRVGVEPE